MKNILLLGAGKIGEMITEMLAGSGDYRVTVADQSETSLARMPKYDAVETMLLNVRDADALEAALAGKFAVLSALPYDLTPLIARAAVKTGVHYFDLTEDVASTRQVKELAKGADTVLMPQCGLAPGFISIAGHDMAKRFDTVKSLRLRVGALPQFPSNKLSYNLTWSTEGVINEYCEPCEAISNGRLTEVPALSGLETFAIDGTSYEAFNTSGGLGTLCDTWGGKLEDLNYRSIRYPGHCDVMKTLIHDLKLGERRDLFRDVLEQAIPGTMQDLVLVFVTASGQKDGRFLQESYVNKTYAREIGGKMRSAIQITTSSGVCAVIDMVAKGGLPQSGFLRQEDVVFSDFLANRFGSNYARTELKTHAA